VYSVPVYSVQCTVCSVQCAVYSVHWYTEILKNKIKLGKSYRNIREAKTARPCDLNQASES